MAKVVVANDFFSRNRDLLLLVATHYLPSIQDAFALELVCRTWRRHLRTLEQGWNWWWQQKARRIQLAVPSPFFNTDRMVVKWMSLCWNPRYILRVLEKSQFLTFWALSAYLREQVMDLRIVAKRGSSVYTAITNSRICNFHFFRKRKVIHFVDQFGNKSNVTQKEFIQVYQSWFNGLIA